MAGGSADGVCSGAASAGGGSRRAQRPRRHLRVPGAGKSTCLYSCVVVCVTFQDDFSACGALGATSESLELVDLHAFTAVYDFAGGRVLPCFESCRLWFLRFGRLHMLCDVTRCAATISRGRRVAACGEVAFRFASNGRRVVAVVVVMIFHCQQKLCSYGRYAATTSWGRRAAARRWRSPSAWRCSRRCDDKDQFAYSLYPAHCLLSSVRPFALEVQPQVRLYHPRQWAPVAAARCLNAAADACRTLSMRLLRLAHWSSLSIAGCAPLAVLRLRLGHQSPLTSSCACTSRRMSCATSMRISARQKSLACWAGSGTPTRGGWSSPRLFPAAAPTARSQVNNASTAF